MVYTGQKWDPHRKSNQLGMLFFSIPWSGGKFLDTELMKLGNPLLFQPPQGIFENRASWCAAYFGIFESMIITYLTTKYTYLYLYIYIYELFEVGMFFLSARSIA